MSERRKRGVSNTGKSEGVHFTTPQFIAFVLMIAILVPMFFRIFNSPSPSSLNEINSITSILEVLVAVLAIMGFELFIWIYESLRKVDKFDERIDKIESKVLAVANGMESRLTKLELFSQSMGLKMFSVAIETLKLEQLTNTYLSILSVVAESEDYRDGMSIVFSKAAEIFKYAERLFYVYFDDENMEIDDRKFNMSISAIEYFLGATDENSANTFCEIFNLRLREARNRVKTWKSLLDSVTDRLRGCVNPGECDDLKRKRDHLKEKIKREKQISRKVYDSIKELNRIEGTECIPDVENLI